MLLPIAMRLMLLCHGHIRICGPFVDGTFVISNLVKANGSEDRGKISRSYTHSSVDDKVIIGGHACICHDLNDFFRRFRRSVFVEQ